MAEKMKILYINMWHAGHFPHMYPYYEKLGGLIFLTDKDSIERLNQEYPNLKIISDLKAVNEFQPDIVMFADYHDVIKNIRNTKVVMVFHAIENKGYFAAVKSWNFCEDFDLCLLYGEKIAKEFKDNGFNIKGKIIGYPRFDNIKKITESIFKNDKKIVLVAPTWSFESLLTKFTDSVIKLSEKYNVIVKPHNQTTMGKDCNVENFKKLIRSKSDSLVVYSNCDILPLMEYSDLMITDVSGCSNEYMFFDRPIIIADNDVLPVVTGKKPIIWDSLPVCDNPDELLALVDFEFENDSMRKKRNEYFKNIVYTEENSTATERGIKAMKELLNKGEKDEK